MINVKRDYGAQRSRQPARAHEPSQGTALPRASGLAGGLSGILALSEHAYVLSTESSQIVGWNLLKAGGDRLKV